MSDRTSVGKQSELSRRISILKGNISNIDVQKGANISHETLRKIKQGQSVRLETVLDIANFLKATEDQKNELIIAWIKMELGEHANGLSITPARGGQLKDADNEIISLLRQLSPEDQRQFKLAMTRPAVRRALPALNEFQDHLVGARAPLTPKKISYRK